MICCIFGDKPLSKSLLIYQLEPMENNNSKEFIPKSYVFVQNNIVKCIIGIYNEWISAEYGLKSWSLKIISLDNDRLLRTTWLPNPTMNLFTYSWTKTMIFCFVFSIQSIVISCVISSTIVMISSGKRKHIEIH